MQRSPGVLSIRRTACERFVRTVRSDCLDWRLHPCGILGGGGARPDNDAGIVVGNSHAAGSTASRGFRWSQSVGMKDLNLVGSTLGTGPIEWFTASDVNNANVIVGNFFNGNDIHTSGGYLLGWSVSIVPTCSQYGGLIASDVNAINDQGYFTGSVFCESGPVLNPYVASLTTMTHFPDDIGGSSESAGYAISASNRVVRRVEHMDPECWLQTPRC